MRFASDIENDGKNDKRVVVVTACINESLVDLYNTADALTPLQDALHAFV